MPAQPPNDGARLDTDAENGKAYWSTWTAGKVERGSLDGSGSVELVPTVPGVGPDDGSPAIDPIGLKLYWGYQSGELMRRNADGSGDIEVLFTGLDAPDGLALDAGDGKIYFATNDKMMRANMDGTGTPEILFPAPGGASNIVLDYVLFADDFESGGMSSWSTTTP